MTLPKKGLRKIEYNGRIYGWLIRKKPTWNQGLRSPMTLAIQEMECDSPKVLHVTLNIDRPDNWLEEHQTQIKPRNILDIIESATIRGWEYDGGGAAFEFNHDITKHT